MYGLSFTLGCLVLLAADKTGPQSHLLRFKADPDPGKSAVVHARTTSTARVKALDDDGAVLMDLKEAWEMEEEYTETVQKLDGGLPTEFTRAYARAVRREGKQERVLPHQGRTVRYKQRPDGTYQITVVGLPAPGAEELKLLDDSASARSGQFARATLPARPVKAGDTWPVPAASLALFGKAGVLDLGRSKGKGKLLKVYPKDGKQFGALEFCVALTWQSIRNLHFDPPGRQDVTVTLETPIDGSGVALQATTRTTTAGRGVALRNGNRFPLDVTSELVVRVRRAEQK